ncbi:putative RTX toxin domain protein, partial [Vibrio parahaemolyticus EKP-021]
MTKTVFTMKLTMLASY